MNEFRISGSMKKQGFKQGLDLFPGAKPCKSRLHPWLRGYKKRYLMKSSMCLAQKQLTISNHCFLLPYRSREWFRTHNAGVDARLFLV